MLKVKQCCHSPSQKPRFSAGIGDWVLVIKDKKVLKGKVISFPTSESADLRLEDDEIVTVTDADITVVMIED